MNASTAVLMQVQKQRGATQTTTGFADKNIQKQLKKFEVFVYGGVREAIQFPLEVSCSFLAILSLPDWEVANDAQSNILGVDQWEEFRSH